MMKRFRIRGTSRKTGRQRNRIYAGENEEDARQRAEADGVEISEVTPLPPPPATEAQIMYARDLGINFPAEIDMYSISDLISRATGALDRVAASDELRFKLWRRGIEIEEDLNEARANELLETYELAQKVGVVLGEHITTAEMDAMPDLCKAMQWVYSVCRHVAGAQWVTFADSAGAMDRREVQAVAQILAADPKLMDQIWEQDHGFDDAYEDAAEARGIDIWAWDDYLSWYFFGRKSFASTRIRAYKIVASAIRIHQIP